MIVKVQVSEASSDAARVNTDTDSESTRRVLIYDEAKTIVREFEAHLTKPIAFGHLPVPQAAKGEEPPILRALRGRSKAFFHARLRPGGALEIDREAPSQNW